MIKTFKCKDTEELYNTGECRRFKSIEHVALRKLDMIQASIRIDVLRIPPANHLEMLRGDRAGQFSIRIKDQYRICFRFEGTDAFDVDIEDYH